MKRSHLKSRFSPFSVFTFGIFTCHYFLWQHNPALEITIRSTWESWDVCGVHQCEFPCSLSLTSDCPHFAIRRTLWTRITCEITDIQICFCKQKCYSEENILPHLGLSKPIIAEQQSFNIQRWQSKRNFFLIFCASLTKLQEGLLWSAICWCKLYDARLPSHFGQCFQLWGKEEGPFLLQQGQKKNTHGWMSLVRENHIKHLWDELEWRLWDRPSHPPSMSDDITVPVGVLSGVLILVSKYCVVCPTLRHSRFFIGEGVLWAALLAWFVHCGSRTGDIFFTASWVM